MSFPRFFLRSSRFFLSPNFHDDQEDMINNLFIAELEEFNRYVIKPNTFVVFKSLDGFLGLGSRRYVWSYTGGFSIAAIDVSAASPLKVSRKYSAQRFIAISAFKSNFPSLPLHAKLVCFGDLYGR
ncbi:hypothetical protein ACFFRR_005476 [Megaselia abdita]